MLVSLTDLNHGEAAEVIALNVGQPARRQQLLAVGCIPGAVLKILSIAPFGGRYQVQVGNGLQVCLGATDGAAIQVKKLPL